MQPLLYSGLAVPRRIERQLATLLLVSCLIAGSVAASAAESNDQARQTAAPLTAKWAPHKLHFMYSAISPSSTTTYYSCDALQQKITSILQELGASADLVVRPVGCIGGGRPERFPGVDATFSALEPLGTGNESTAHSQDVASRWENVTLTTDASCALIEQVKRNILPLFSTRNASSGCSPRFSVEVLRPVKSPGPESAPR